jgi:hypothetical protein
MKRWFGISLALWALLLPLAQPVLSQEDDEQGGKSLFVNLTSDEVNRAHMAITLARRVLAEKKIPVTIWLNVEGVRLLNGHLLQVRYDDGRNAREDLEAFRMSVGSSPRTFPRAPSSVRWGSSGKRPLPTMPPC